MPCEDIRCGVKDCDWRGCYDYSGQDSEDNQEKMYLDHLIEVHNVPAWIRIGTHYCPDPCVGMK